MNDRGLRKSTANFTRQSNTFKSFLLVRDGKNWNKLWVELNGNALKVFTDPTKVIFLCFLL